jgi:hypothetical protein
VLRDVIGRLPAAAAPGGRQSRRSRCPAGRVRGTRFLGGGSQTHYAVDYPAFTVVVLDSQVPGSAGGRLGASQLRWLNEILGRGPDTPALSPCIIRRSRSGSRSSTGWDWQTATNWPVCSPGTVMSRGSLPGMCTAATPQRPRVNRWAAKLSASAQTVPGVELALTEFFGDQVGAEADPPADDHFVCARRRSCGLTGRAEAFNSDDHRPIVPDPYRSRPNGGPGPHGYRPRRPCRRREYVDRRRCRGGIWAAHVRLRLLSTRAT